MRPRPSQLLDYKEFPILYVDDEPENLRVFELAFRREFKIFTATSAEEGLRILNENPVALVLSDQRMPGVTGVEFLARVRDIDAKTIRVLVTAYGDVQILEQAINDGNIYRYVSKPWEPEDMRLTLARAIETYALDQERQSLLEELTLLNRLSKALHSEMDLDRLLNLLMNALVREVEYDGAAILFLECEGDQLSWRGMMPADNTTAQRLREISLQKETAPDFFDSLERGESQVLRMDDDEFLEPAVREWVTEVSADEILVIPLVGKDQVIGALAVDNRRGGKSFGAEDHTLLDGLSTQAVIAIENARSVEALRSSREQVMRADRLGTLGTMAAGLAHEINNPLVSINTFLTLAPEKRNEADDAFWGEYHQLASAELSRVQSLVSTMSRLARGHDDSQSPKTEVDLCDLSYEVTSLLQRDVQNKNIALDLKVDEKTPEVLGVRDHLHQVLLNLIINALQATSERGRVGVQVSPDPDHPGHGALLRISDSGHGIADENIERIFDPFFTTKDPDKGTGLGLMIAHEIVADHGGEIEVSSSPGQGSTFSVKLPTSAPRAQPFRIS